MKKFIFLFSFVFLVFFLFSFTQKNNFFGVHPVFSYEVGVCGNGDCESDWGEGCSNCSDDCGSCCTPEWDCGYTDCTASCGGGTREYICTDLNGCFSPDSSGPQDCNTQTCPCEPICSPNGSNCGAANGCGGTCQICEGGCAGFGNNCDECISGTQTCRGKTTGTNADCTVTQSCNTNIGAVSCDCGASSGYTQVECVPGAECIGDLGGGCHYCAAPPITPLPTAPPSGGGEGCDSSCGTCGFKNTDGSCTTNYGCCHTECQGENCVTVFGGGANGCSWDSGCTAPDPEITCYKCVSGSCTSYQTTAAGCSTNCNGCINPHQISGTIYNDLNNDGAINASDTLFNGAKIKLQNNQSGTSNSSGAYTITNVFDGTYTASPANTPTGYKSVAPSSQSITVNGVNVTGINFLVRGYTISGTVFTDTDNDGEKDAGENGYSGATVSLSGPTTRSPVTTPSSGIYSFTDLIAGTYTITVNGVTNYKFTTPSSCTSLSQGTNCPEPVVISNLDKTLDFGIIPVYSVQGTIFSDINKDEIMNTPGESGYNGTSTIEVRNSSIISCSGSLVASVGTNGTISTNNGVFDTGKNLVPGNYDICYTSLADASQYVLTYPNNGGTPFFAITVGASCSVGGHNTATCSSGNIINLNFGISNNYAWYQCIGADCRDDDGITNIVPNPTDPTYATCGTNPNYYAAIPQAAGGTHGIIFSGENSYSFCAGAECPERSSSSQWLVGKASLGGKSFAPIRAGVMRTSYGSFTALAQQNNITPTPLTTTQCGTGDISSCDLSTSTLPNGIYKSNGDLTLTSTTGSYTFPVNKNYVILVNGDLTIETNIKVPTTSTVTFSVSGDITIDRTIGESTYTSINSNIEGFYSTDKSFIIDGYGVGGCVAGGTRDKRLNIAGSVVANAGLTTGAINNGRDLCEANLQCPSYSIIERPDFILNAPDFIKHPNYIWQEVAP